MKKIRISQFNGGQSEMEQNTSIYNSDIGNFDIYTDNGKLLPIKETDSVTMEAGYNVNDNRLQNVFRVKWTSNGLNKKYAIGYNSSSDLRPRLFADDLNNDNFIAKGLITDISAYNGNMEMYNNLPHFTSYNNGTNTYYLGNFNNEASNSLASFTGATLTNPSYGITDGSPILYSSIIDNRLYIAQGNIIRVWNGSSLITGITLPADRVITSLTLYSSYLTIATISENGNSRVYLWDRDTSLVEFTSIVDFGNSNLSIIEMLNGILFGFMYKDGLLEIKAYAGGEVQTIKSFNVGITKSLQQIKKVINNKLYFALREDNALWCLYKNKAGNYTVSKEMYTLNGNSTQIVTSISFVDNKMYISGYDNTDNTYKLLKTKTNPLYTNTSYYITTENPSMDNDDLSRYKILKRVYITFKHSDTPILPILALYASFDGSDWVKMIEETKTAGTYTFDTSKDVNGENVNDFIQIKFKVELSQRYAEILEIGYIYENTNKNNI